MIGYMIANIREEKGLTKTELARLTNINIGHLTHIEKGERNPSHKTLRNICQALNIPYQQLMYTYDKCMNEDSENYDLLKHISYDKVLAIDKLDDFIPCPVTTPSASVAIKMPDASMEPKYKKGEYLFIEFNSLLNNKDVGLFRVDNNFYIRRFIKENNKFILRSDNKSTKDVVIIDNTDFYIIGKVLDK